MRAWRKALQRSMQPSNTAYHCLDDARHLLATFSTTGMHRACLPTAHHALPYDLPAGRDMFSASDHHKLPIRSGRSTRMPPVAPVGVYFAFLNSCSSGYGTYAGHAHQVQRRDAATQTAAVRHFASAMTYATSAVCCTFSLRVFIPGLVLTLRRTPACDRRRLPT